MNSRLFRLIGAAAVCFFCFGVQDAFAWGPVTHVRLASDVLANLSLLPAAVAALLARYAPAYVYGTLAADVVFAKRMSRIKQICHHWSTGFRLLDEAACDRERAFAYGYLSHLAADTVAHGKFVPYHVVATGTTLSFGHLYWELRADSAAGEPARLELKRVIQMAHDQHHNTLEAVLRNTLLPYPMNRALFERINRLATRPGYHRSLEIWGRFSRWDLCPILLTNYHGESLDRTMSLLAEGKRSAVLADDPSGTAALAFAADHRREVRRRRRRGLPVHHRGREAAAGHAPRRKHH